MFNCNIAAGPGHPKLWILRKSYIKTLPTHDDLLLLHPSLNPALLSINNPENTPTCLPFSPSLPRLLPLHLLHQLIQFLVSPSQQDQLQLLQLLAQIPLRSTSKPLATVELDVPKAPSEVLYQPINQRELVQTIAISKSRIIITLREYSFTLIFDAYVASIGPGIAVTQNRLNCQLNIDLQYPGGFQYSILGTQFRGYAGLDAGITGLQQATYYFSGCK